MCSCPLSTVRFLKAIGAGKGGEEDRGPVAKDLTKCKTLLDTFLLTHCPSGREPVPGILPGKTPGAPGYLWTVRRGSEPAKTSHVLLKATIKMRVF